MGDPELRLIAGHTLDGQYVEVLAKVLRDKDLAYRDGDMDKAVALDPKNVQYLYQLGAAQERARMLDRAEATFRKLLELDAKHADAYNYLGYMFAEEGIKLDEAVLKKLDEIFPGPGGESPEAFAW